jgi:hypothetical protein
MDLDGPKAQDLSGSVQLVISCSELGFCQNWIHIFKTNVPELVNKQS